jgi:predicted dehydrogenase
LNAFLGALRDGTDSPVPMSEALPAHRLVDAIYASADEDGRTIAL